MPIERTPFYTVVRIFFKNNEVSHSVQYFEDRAQAMKRYFNILGTDTGTEGVTYNACYLIDNTGLMLEGRSFDERPIPEPEPEESEELIEG
jgi:hypothetical protein